MKPTDLFSKQNFFYRINRVKNYLNENSQTSYLDIEDENNFNAAIFYSISAMETGLRGIDLGHRLIVSACDEMKEQSETAKLTQWSSLSPVPLFRKWCENTIQTDPTRIANLIGDTNLEKFKLLVKDKQPELDENFR